MGRVACEAADAARAASATSSTPHPLRRRPAKIAAASASRYVSRAKPSVKRFEQFRGLEQQRRSVTPAPAGKHDLGAQPRERARAGARPTGRSPPSRGARSPSPGAAASNLAWAAAKRPRAAPGRIGRQLRRPFQKRGRRRDATAALVPGRPSAPARRPPPRRARPRRGRGATHGDRDRRPDRSPPPARDVPPGGHGRSAPRYAAERTSG